MATVGDIMTREVIAVAPFTSTAEALRLAQRRGIHHLLVTDASTLQGVLCTCDLWSADSKQLVAQRMKRPRATVAAEAVLSAAADLMRTNHVGCLPVLKGGDLLGVLTRADLRKHGFDHVQDLGGSVCSCCGSVAHVHPHPRMEGLSLCNQCQDRATAPDDTQEIGIGD